jgi:hypothetical protein
MKWSGNLVGTRAAAGMICVTLVSVSGCKEPRGRFHDFEVGPVP